MSETVFGNRKSLSVSEVKEVQKLYNLSCDTELIVTEEICIELLRLSKKFHRRIALLVNRRGQIEHVIMGTHGLLYLPPLPQISADRLRGLRFIISCLHYW